MNAPAPPDQKPQRAIREEAARWHARLNSPRCTVDTEMEFNQWLTADPLHALAYEQCKMLWQMSGYLERDEDIQRELAAARAAAAIGKVHGAGAKAPPESAGAGAGRRPVWLQIAAALLVVAIGFIFALPRHDYDVYSTRIGEQRSLRLADGSTVMLNTDTVVAVRLERGRRKLQLRRGEAYFDVAKDPQRPFEVRAATNTVRALGTAFNIVVREGAVSVSVTEGVVEVKAEMENRTTPTVIAKIKPGEAITYRNDGAIPAVEAANLKRISAWQERKIYFESERLANAVAEYNRYMEKDIQILDQRLENQLISGVFNIGDIEAFVFSLEQLLDARIVKNNGHILIMSKFRAPKADGGTDTAVGS